MIEMSLHDIWILAIAFLSAAAAAVIGVFLVLRKMAMLADAISHSVVLSIALAFLITGAITMQVVWIVAIFIGLLSAFLVELLTKNKNLSTDSAIGLSFTTFFSLGVILISTFASQIDLDQDCILFGEIALAPFNTVVLAGVNWGPESFWHLLFVNLLIGVFVIIGYRQLKCLAFDPILAQVLGIKTNFWHYGLTALLSILVISAFEAIGAILIIGMLVIPANFAFLLSSNLRRMIFLAIIFSWLCCIIGYILARHFDLSIAAAIVVAMGVLFMFTCLIKKIIERIKVYQATVNQ